MSMSEKKIGVITWFHYENYGTALQAIALQTYLRNHGCIPELIDFPIVELPIIHPKKKLITDRAIRKLIRESVNIKHPSATKLKSIKFHDSIYNNCFVTKPITDVPSFIDKCNSYDLLICGSDQIWNPNWYCDFYYANYPGIKTPKISYAASIGVEHLPEHLIGSYYNALSKFSALSVREKSAQMEFEQKFGINSLVVLDPTLLISANTWEKIANQDTDMSCKDNNYILVYILTDNKNHWKAIHDFSKRNKLKIKIIPMEEYSYLQNGEIIRGAGPFDFVNLIKNAKIVITDSFHATVFSIIFHKIFYTFERTDNSDESSQNSRIYSLLDACGLNNRIVKYNSTDIFNNDKIDYITVDQKLINITRSSEQFLLKNVE